jgi:hypothetical protein
MKPGIAKRRMTARLRVLDRLIRSLRQMAYSTKKKHSVSLGYILEHNLRMVETESKFLSNLIDTL